MQKKEFPEGSESKFLLVADSPIQFNLFTKEPEPVPIEISSIPSEGEETLIDDGITMVKTGDTSQIILSGFGLFLSKRSERLIVKKGQKSIYEFPLFRINEIVVASRGISLSTDLIDEACKRGIRLSFLSGNGRPYAMISSPLLTATHVDLNSQKS